MPSGEQFVSTTATTGIPSLRGLADGNLFVPDVDEEDGRRQRHPCS